MAARARAKLSLYFDVVSPYTHLSLHTWSRYLPLWNVDLRLRPVFLGGIMKSTGNKPPGVLPQKMEFMRQDLARFSQQANIPLLKIPNNFFSEVARATLAVQRTLSAAELHGLTASQQLDLALGFSNVIHADKNLRNAENDLNISPPLFHAAFEQACVDEKDAKAIMEQSGKADAKAALQAATEEAVARGAFGSPTVFVESGAVCAVSDSAMPAGEEFMIFGSDRMEQLAWSLGQPYSGPNPGK
jgi:glutathione S-transferase kappa 1